VTEFEDGPLAQDTIVFSARKIVTMNPSRPSATHVAVREGRIKPQINQRFPLADAQEAHRALESRSTTGSTLLIP
jgi:NADPH:quinone reductase-like Zn-dependent oxidoreductase